MYQMKIVGIEPKKGEYQGREYNNFLIHCVVSDDKVIGKLKTDTIKFKYSNLTALCPAANLDSWIGREISNVYYDKYGNAINVGFKN